MKGERGWSLSVHPPWTGYLAKGTFYEDNRMLVVKRLIPETHLTFLVWAGNTLEIGNGLNDSYGEETWRQNGFGKCVEW